jgi:hypothetical protein
MLLVMRRGIRILAGVCAILLLLGVAFAVFCCPKNLSHFSVSLNRDPHGSTGWSRCEVASGHMLALGSYRSDDFEGKYHMQMESHIARLAREGVTIRLHLRESTGGRVVTSVDRLLFFPTDRPWRIDLKPGIYLTSAVD